MNKVILMGRLTADPELRQTQSGIAVVSFSVAVNRRFSKNATQQSETDFFNVTAWRQTAEFITRYFRKASSICVVGSIQTRSWIDQNGQKRFATEIVADEAYFVDAKNEMPGQAVGAAAAPAGATNAAGNGYAAPANYAPQGGSYASQGYAAPAPAPKFEDVADDEDLPF